MLTRTVNLVSFGLQATADLAQVVLALQTLGGVRRDGWGRCKGRGDAVTEEQDVLLKYLLVGLAFVTGSPFSTCKMTMKGLERVAHAIGSTGRWEHGQVGAWAGGSTGRWEHGQVGARAGGSTGRWERIMHVPWCMIGPKVTWYFNPTPNYCAHSRLAAFSSADSLCFLFFFATLSCWESWGSFSRPLCLPTDQPDSL